MQFYLIIILQSNGAVKCQVINVTEKQVQKLFYLNTVAFTIDSENFAQQTKLINKKSLVHQGCTVYRD